MGPTKALPLGMQQILAATLAAATPLTVPAGADFAIISVAVASTSVSWTDNSVAPTASLGIQLANGADPFEYHGNLHALQFILSVGVPILNVAYYKNAG